MEAEDVQNKLLKRLLADMEAGLLQELERYQAAWPEHAELVAREYRHVCAEKGAGPAGPPSEAERSRLLEQGFELIEELGRGAFGRVWRARDRALDKEVALKILSTKDLPLTREQCQRFIREARILAALDHPNIVRIHSIDDQDGELRICLELVAGRTLEALVRERGVLSAREAAQVGLEICRALAAVHARGLIHGDLKHANVMRAEGGRIVLLDFGLARYVDPAASGRWSGGLVGGTPLFMAPELFRGDESVDGRADLYALGVLLYWLVSSDFPVRSKDVVELQGKLLQGRAVPLRDRRPDLPARFVQIVQRLLAQAPAQRPPSAGAVEEELLGFLAGGQPSTEGGAARRGLRRPAVLVPLGLLVVLAAFVALARPWNGGSVEAGFRVRLLRAGTNLELSDLDEVRYKEEHLVLEVHPSRDGYLYLLNEDLQGNVFVLFPQAGCELGNPVRGGEVLELPGACENKKPYYVYDTPSGGRDRLLLIEAPEQIHWIEEEIRRKEAGGKVALVELDARGRSEVHRGLGIGVESPPEATKTGSGQLGPFPFLAGIERKRESRWRIWSRELVTR